VFCNAKYRGGVRRTEGLKNSDSNKIKYQTPPLPCPAALRGVVYKIEAEAKGEYISPSSSVFCAAKYRGSARRARGLEYNDSNKIKYQSSPPAVPSSIAGRYKTIGRKGYFSTLLPCVLRSKI